MAHLFKVGQQVRRSHSGYSDASHTASGVYVVVRLMPEDQTGERSYRVKSEGGERVMREGEIVLAAR